MKATIGIHKGTWQRIAANGSFKKVAPIRAASMKIKGEKWWAKEDAKRKAIINRDKGKVPKGFIDAAMGDELTVAQRESRRSRAKTVVAELASGGLPLNPEDTFNQANVAGDKSLITDQNWQRPPNVNAKTWAKFKDLKDQLKALSRNHVDEYIKNKVTHGDTRTDAEIKAGFKEDRASLGKDIQDMKDKQPELSMVYTKDGWVTRASTTPKTPIPDLPQSFYDRQRRIDASIAAADQTPTVPTKKVVNGKVVNRTQREIDADVKRAEAALKIQAAIDEKKNRQEQTSRSRRSGAGTGPKKPRSASTGPSKPRITGKTMPKATVYDTVEDKDNRSILLGNTAKANIDSSEISAETDKLDSYSWNASDFKLKLTDAEIDKYNAEHPGGGFAPAERNEFAGIMKDPNNEFGVVATYRRAVMAPKRNAKNELIKVQAPLKNGKVQLDKNGDPKMVTVPEHVRDAKGNLRYFNRAYKYTAERQADSKGRKDARVLTMETKLPKFDKELKTEMLQTDTGAAVALMRMLGIRVGATIAEQEKKKAEGGGSKAKQDVREAAGIAHDWIYGATTLRRRHVRIVGDRVLISFQGKDNVQNMHNVANNPMLLKLVRHLLKNAPSGKDVELTPSANQGTAKLFIHARLPGITPHNLRTYLANVLAAEEMAKMPIPTTEAEYYAARNAVLLTVTDTLNNQPTQAYKTYINKGIWSAWKKAANVVD